MSNCKKCGSVLKPGEYYCNNCGTLDIQPVKRARWGWLPWAVAAFTAATALVFLVPMAVYAYRDKTGYFDRLNQARAAENVSITDAIDTSFKNELTGERERFRYPNVTIKILRSGKKKTEEYGRIERDIEKYYEGNNRHKYAADYSYHIDKTNVVSVLVEVRSLSGTPSSRFYVYNISVNSGNTKRDEALISDLKISDEAFNQLVEETYKSYFKTADLTEWEKDELLDNISYSELNPYIGEDGHLCFAVKISKEDGSSEWAIFDTDTKKRLDGPLSK
ncbi:MAG: zinc ribbon domain-containing protein [Clostridiales bacterium]|nr:zinc ribbon domain-containing protein [Clostridiales bacterium]